MNHSFNQTLLYKKHGIIVCIYIYAYLFNINQIFVYIYIYRSFCSKYLELRYTYTPTGTTQRDMSSQPCLRNKYASHHGVHHGLIGCRHHSSFPQMVSRAQPSAKACGVEKNTSPYPLTVLLEDFLLFTSEFVNILEYPELTYICILLHWLRNIGEYM